MLLLRIVNELSRIKSQKYFDSHIEWHRQKITDLEESVKCSSCDLTVEKKWDLNKHIYSEHPDDDMVCPVCCELVPMKSLFNHLYHHYNNLKKPCDICGIRLRRRPMLVHRSKAHGIGTNPNEVAKKLCPYCGKEFGYSALKLHIYNHHEPYVWKCKICAKEFNNNQTATNHTHFHSITKPWKCFLCDYCSYNKSNVGIHLKKVHKETENLYSRIIKTCEYLYEKDFKGGLLEKILKPEGATYSGNKKVMPASYQRNRGDFEEEDEEELFE